MNAHVSTPVTADVLTQAIVNNVSLIRRIAEGAPASGIKALAEEFGRDASNLGKAVKALTEDGVLKTDEGGAIAATDLARRILQGVDVATGKLVLPANFVIRRHDQLVPSPLNPRTDWDSEEAIEALDSMRLSILEVGIRMPIEIRAGAEGEPEYIVSGERRWRAAGMAIAEGDLPDDFPILCKLVDVTDDEEHLVLALEENITRKQLNLVEEAKAFNFLATAHRWTTQKIADRFGTSVKNVQDKLAMLSKASPEILAQLERGEVTYRQVRESFQEKKPEPALFGKGADSLPKQKKGEAKAPADPEPPAFAVNERQALVIIELAHKVENEPAEHLDNYTAVADTPDDKLTAELIERGVITFRNFRGQHYGKVMMFHSGARDWLQGQGFFDDRETCLMAARTAVIGEAKARQAETDDSFVTDWLNVPEPEPEAPSVAPPPAPAPPTQAAPPAADEPGSSPAAAAATYGSSSGSALTGDAFSQQIRALQDEDEAEYLSPAQVAQEARDRAQAQPQPAPAAAAQTRPVSTLDFEVGGDIGRGVSDLLVRRRNNPAFPEHWSLAPAGELAAVVLEYLADGQLLDACAMIGALRNKVGPNEAGEIMRRLMAERVMDSRSAG